MTEIRDFFRQLDELQHATDEFQNVPADWLDQSADQLHERQAQLAQQIAMIQSLVERVNANYGSKFVAPVPPDSDPPEEIAQQALVYFGDDHNYSFLLRPAGGFAVRRVKEEDYVWFMTMAEAAKRQYSKLSRQMEQIYVSGKNSFRNKLNDYKRTAEKQLANTRPLGTYKPAGSGSSCIYLGDILQPQELETEFPADNRWLTDEWVRMPFCFAADRPYTLFIDAPDVRGFDTMRENTGKLLRSIIYQTIRAMPGYTCQFYVVDTGKAAGFLRELQGLKKVVNGSAYMMDESVCGHLFRMLQTATTQEQAAELLHELDERMGRIAALCGGEGNLIEYNAKQMQGGTILKNKTIVPQSVVIVENVHTMSSAQLEVLKRLVVNSWQCGISIIMTSGRTQDEPLNEEEKELRKITSDWLELIDEEWYADLSAVSLGEKREREISRMHFDFAPWLEIYPDKGYLDAIQESLRPNTNLETAMEQRIDIDAVWGKGDASDVIRVPVGVNERGEVTYIEIGGPDGAHALLAGSTGCGKSTLLHAIINGVIIHYKPTDVQLWLADYKLNEFQRYAENTPPHIKFVGISRSMEYSLALVEKIHSEMERRQQLFGKCTSVKEYRKQNGPDSMPRILVVIDEFHKMSDHVRDDPERKQMLTNILKEARSVGISLLLSDQTCGIGLKGLSEEGKEQLTLRMSMRSSYDEYNAVMGINNAKDVRELVALRKWEVTLKRSKTEKNEFGNDVVKFSFEWNRTLYLSNEECRLIAERAITDYGRNEDVKVTRTGVRIRPDWEAIDKYEHMELLPLKPRTMRVFLGVPTTLESFMPVELRTNFEENIMCVGSDDDELLSLMEQMVNSIFRLREPAQIYMMADEYEPMYDECEPWMRRLAVEHPNVTLCIGEEEVCRGVAHLNSLTHRRMREKGTKERIFVFWIGMPGLVQSLSDYPDTRPAALQEDTKAGKKKAKGGSGDLAAAMEDLGGSFEALFGSAGSENAAETDVPDFLSGKETLEPLDDLSSLDEPIQLDPQLAALLNGSAAEAEAEDDTAAQEEELPLYNIFDEVQEIVKLGPRQSICTVVLHTSVSAIRRARCAPEDEFRHRIAFGIGTDEALTFLNSSKAIKDAEGNMLDDAMAVYYDGRSYHQFAPFIGTVEAAQAAGAESERIL